MYLFLAAPHWYAASGAQCFDVYSCCATISLGSCCLHQSALRGSTRVGGVCFLFRFQGLIWGLAFLMCLSILEVKMADSAQLKKQRYRAQNAENAIMRLPDCSSTHLLCCCDWCLLSLTLLLIFFFKIADWSTQHVPLAPNEVEASPGQHGRSAWIY